MSSTTNPVSRVLGLVLDIILILLTFIVIEFIAEYFKLTATQNLMGFLDGWRDEGVMEWGIIKSMISNNVLKSIITLVVSFVLYWLFCRALFKKTLGRKIFG